MANFLTLTLLACLVVAVCAETSVERFDKLRHIVFIEEQVFDPNTEDYIKEMITLIESGQIAAQDEDKNFINYLHSLVNDCEISIDCNLELDLAKLDRLKEKRTKACNLNTYLNVCMKKVKNICIEAASERVSDKLKSVDEQSLATIDTVARLVDENSRTIFPSRYIDYDYASSKDLNINYPEIVIKALKSLDPQGAEAAKGKWSNKQEQIEKFLGQIQSPCLSYLDHIDPVVKYFSYEYSKPDFGLYFDIQNKHFYKKVCENIISKWYSIVKEAPKHL